MKLYMLNPKNWYSHLNRYNKEWDLVLNKLLDDFPVKLEFNRYSGECLTAKLGKITVWIGNYPYGFGNPYQDNSKLGIRPSKKTINRLYNAVKEQQKLIKQEYISKGLNDIKAQMK